MSTLLYLSSIFVVEKCNFLKIVKIPYPEKSIFGQFEVIFHV